MLGYSPSIMYCGKKHARHDPNERRYDRQVEQLVKQMDPREQDDLLHGDAEDPQQAPGS